MTTPSNENTEHVNNGDVARDDVRSDADVDAGEVVDESNDHDLAPTQHSALEDNKNGDDTVSR